MPRPAIEMACRIDPVTNEAIANCRRAGERQRLIGAEVSERVGVPDNLDLIGRTQFDVVEDCAVGDRRGRCQLVAAQHEVKPEMVRQDRLRCDRRAGKSR